MAEAKKTDPDLWEEVKEELKQSDKGGDPGQWSARKAQMAVQEYKKRGGGYEDDGPSQEETHLHEWTEEDWGTKSGQESLDSGERYLPKKVRMLLTEDEYRRSTEKKKGAERQFVEQPDDVKEKVSHIRHNGPTKDMLLERAEDLGLDGYTSKTKDELLDMIEEATDENGRKKDGAAGLEAKTKDDLMEMAQERDVEGRSSMSKEELIEALQSAGDEDGGGKTKDELYETAKQQDVEGRSQMSKDELKKAVS